MRVRLFQVHCFIRFIGRMHPKWIVNLKFSFVYVKKIGDHHRGQVGYFFFVYLLPYLMTTTGMSVIVYIFSQ